MTQKDETELPHLTPERRAQKEWTNLLFGNLATLEEITHRPVERDHSIVSTRLDHPGDLRRFPFPDKVPDRGRGHEDFYQRHAPAA